MFDDFHEWLKIIHILSANVLLGTSLGTGFHLWAAGRNGDPRDVAAAARITVWIAFLFTAPAAVIQPLTGGLLMSIMGFEMKTPWLIAAFALFAVAVACWLVIVWLQVQVRDLAVVAAARQEHLPPAFHSATRAWIALGWAALLALAVTVGLMVVKPELW